MTGARAEDTHYGARLVLNRSERRIAYSRLQVEDASGRSLNARIEATSSNQLVVLLNDTDARYPVRIDPTCSDENWISRGGRAAYVGLIQPTVVDVEAPDVLIPHVADADIVVLIGTHLPTQVVEAMTNCRAIARMGAGTDKIDVARATELGIVVANTPYFCVEEQADHAMAMLLSLARKLILAQNAMAEGDIARARRAVSMNQRVSACTLGLVGFGRSAVHMARRARGFGMRVLATRRNEHAPTDEADALGVIMTDLETVLQESDYVSLHLPLNSATHHMIDAAALAKMKPSAYLINTSRGALVDESALADAIRSGRLAGAGIDTYEQMDVFTEIIQIGRAHV